MIDLLIIPAAVLASIGVIRLVTEAGHQASSMAVYRWPDGSHVSRARWGDLEREGTEADDFIVADPEHDVVLTYHDPSGTARAHLVFTRTEGGLLLLGMRGPIDGSLDDDVEARFTMFCMSLSTMVPFVNVPAIQPSLTPKIPTDVPAGQWMVAPTRAVAA